MSPFHLFQWRSRLKVCIILGGLGLGLFMSVQLSLAVAACMKLTSFLRCQSSLEKFGVVLPKTSWLLANYQQMADFKLGSSPTGIWKSLGTQLGVGYCSPDILVIVDISTMLKMWACREDNRAEV